MAQQLTTARPTEDVRLRMSYDDFLAMLGEGVHAEWVDGEVIVFMPPKTKHERLSRLLYYLLGLFVEHFGLGEVFDAPYEMVLIPGKLSREPDLLFVAREHAERITPERLNGPADLVIEIISDSSVTRDRETKFAEYQAAGIPEYWMIDPRPGRQRVRPFALSPTGEYEPIRRDAAGRYHSVVIPGFWLDPAWLWQEPLPDTLSLLKQILAKDAL
jgi:Uma2 family endonuclease